MGSALLGARSDGRFARFGARLATAALALVLCTAALPAGAQSFDAWVQGTAWPRAQAAGVSRATFDAAFAGVVPDWSLPGVVKPGGKPAEVQWQAEFSSPARYFSDDKIAPLVGQGRKLLKEWAKTLAAVEKRYGVPKEIIVAIWGRESGFGRVKMPRAAIPTLATLAYAGERKEMFLPELVAALEILEADHVPLAELRGSLSGALGQPQFLPTKYLAYAVDFDGDGRRDIWVSVPDTLASIANFLAAHGWVAGAWWGEEASVPPAVSCALEGPEQGRPLSWWTGAGVTALGGGAVAGKPGGTRFLMMPAGRLGPAFLVTQNFYVLKSYNESDLYALFVGHVADRLRGGGGKDWTWRTSVGFSRGDVRAMQRRLESMGHDVGGADGLVGFKTRIAVGLWQTKTGAAATCFPDKAVVSALR